MGKGLSWKSVVEILDYLLFLVGNYDYLQSRIISLGKEKVGGQVVSSSFTTIAASPQFCLLFYWNLFSSIQA
nr:hypothetical protein CFP56_52922 [Quercus suber]